MHWSLNRRPPKPHVELVRDSAFRSEREVRLERALRLARGILAGEAKMTADAVTVIDNALEGP